MILEEINNNNFSDIVAIKIDLSGYRINEKKEYQFSIFYFDEFNNLKEFTDTFFSNPVNDVFKYFINTLELCVLNVCDIEECFGASVYIYNNVLFVNHKYLGQIKTKEKLFQFAITLDSITLIVFDLKNYIRIKKLDIPEDQYIYFKLLLSKKKQQERLIEGPFCNKEIEYLERYLPNDLILLTEI